MITPPTNQRQRDAPLDLRGKQVLVMGLGVHGGGLGATRFLVEQGADVTVTDLRSAEQLAITLAQLDGLPIRYVLGEHREADFRTTDLVIRNPGVPRTSRFIKIAQTAGAAVEMEMTLFFRLCPAPIIGITGTKGKTTTTMLTAAMVRQQFPDTVVAGNLRVSAVEQLARITPTTAVVLELSSWQLDGLDDVQMSPEYGAVTNIAPDHLDSYASMNEYIHAKTAIFRHQQPNGFIALNAADPQVAAMASGAPGQVAWFAGQHGGAAHLPLASWTEQGLVWQHGDQREVVITHEDVALPGEHNLVNIAAAATLSLNYGVKIEHIRTAVQRFEGVPHRLETIAFVDGVRYVNDTTATNPTSAIASVKSFAAPTIVIAGGADKNLDIVDFAQTLNAQAKAVVLLNGSATPGLQQALEQAIPSGTQHPPLLGPLDSMRAGLESARDLARAGDVVLLAPGCASFGMFKNEFDRGDQFRQIVQEWADDASTTTKQ